jgi:hypothetical protein
MERHSFASLALFAAKTGDTVLLFNEETGAASAVIPFEKYKELLGDTLSVAQNNAKKSNQKAVSTPVAEEAVATPSDESFFLEPLE